jgi:hypothetical protein
LAKKIRDDFGKIIEVYGVKSLTADSLINAASSFVAIDQNLLL